MRIHGASLNHFITMSDLEEFSDICDDGSEDEFVFLTVEPAQFCYSREKSNKTLKDKILLCQAFLTIYIITIVTRLFQR